MYLNMGRSALPARGVFPKPPIDFPKPPIEFSIPPIEIPKPPIDFPKPPTEFSISPIEIPKPPIVRPGRATGAARGAGTKKSLPLGGGREKVCQARLA